MIGEIRKLNDDLEMWALVGPEHKSMWFPAGTMVKIIDWTPWRSGMKDGDYWTIRTLDDEFSATHINELEIGELSALDRLSLIDPDD